MQNMSYVLSVTHNKALLVFALANVPSIQVISKAFRECTLIYRRHDTRCSVSTVYSWKRYDYGNDAHTHTHTHTERERERERERDKRASNKYYP